MLTTIEFSENWNGKLLLDVFTTIRLENPDKYIQGNVYEVMLRGDLLGRAKLSMIHYFFYKNLNERTARIDTGKSLHYLQTLLNRFYGPMIPDRKLCLLFFEWTERRCQGQTTLIQKHWERCKKQMPPILQQVMTFED